MIGDPVGPLAHSVALNLAFLWPQVALATKRAHDRAHSAWVVVAVTLASMALSYWPVETYGLAGRALDNGDLLGGAGLIAGLAIGAAGLYLLVVLGFLDGTPGPNRFGRSPKGIGGEPAERAAEVFS